MTGETHTADKKMGHRQRRAAALRAEHEAKRRRQQEQTAKAQDTGEADDPAKQGARRAANTAPDHNKAVAVQEQTAPVGTGDYVVQPGDCMSSIADESGHEWEYLWNIAENAGLRAARQDPHMLLPGDRVTVPSIQKKDEPCETEMRHRFRCKGEPTVLRLVVKDADEPRGNEPFILRTKDAEFEGFTDPEGKLEAPIRPSDKEATLIVGEGEDCEEFELNLGHLAPIESISGVQSRLENLGYSVGADDGNMSDATKTAIHDFCTDYGLPVHEGVQFDEQFRNQLREVHGF